MCWSMRGRALPNSSATAPNCGCRRRSAAPCRSSIPPNASITGKITFNIPGLRREAIQPVGIGITKDGKTAFIALGPANRIAVVDATSHTVTKYLLVGQRVWHMAFTPDEKYLLVTNGVSNDVSVIDVSAQKVIKTIQVGELPWGITIAQP